MQKKQNNNKQELNHHLFQSISWESLGIGDKRDPNHSYLTPTEWVVWLWLRYLVNSHHNRTMQSWGSITMPTNASKIHKVLGIPVRSIQESIKRLREKGYIETVRIYNPGNLVIRLIKLPETTVAKEFRYCKIDIKNFIKMVKTLPAFDVKVLIGTYIHYKKHCNDVTKIRKSFMAKLLCMDSNRIFESFARLTKHGYFKVDKKGLITKVLEWNIYDGTSKANLLEILGDTVNINPSHKLGRITVACKPGEKILKKFGRFRIICLKSKQYQTTFQRIVDYSLYALKAIRTKCFSKKSLAYMYRHLQYATNLSFDRLEYLISLDWQTPKDKQLNPYFILHNS